MKQKQALPRLSEKQWQAQVVELARLSRWLAYHTYNSRHSAKGFPDLVLCHTKTPRVVYAELKSEDGELTADQQKWIHALTLAKQAVYVWRPSQWDEVVRLLMGNGS